MIKREGVEICALNSNEPHSSCLFPFNAAATTFPQTYKTEHQTVIPRHPLLQMEKTWPLPRLQHHFFFLLPLHHIMLSQTVTAAAAAAAGGFGVGGGVGIGIGGGGGGVWVGGGVNVPMAPPSSEKLDLAYKVLQAWKSSITGDPNGYLRSWVGPNVCSYTGVFCSSSSAVPFVAGIDLNRAKLEGVLVKDLAGLTDLALLHLNSNRFSGSIPSTFQGLVSLRELDLSNNVFSGPFPEVILSMPSLVYVDLRSAKNINLVFRE